MPFSELLGSATSIACLHRSFAAESVYTGAHRLTHSMLRGEWTREAGVNPTRNDREHARRGPLRGRQCRSPLACLPHLKVTRSRITETSKVSSAQQGLRPRRQSEPRGSQASRSQRRRKSSSMQPGQTVCGERVAPMHNTTVHHRSLLAYEATMYALSECE